MDDNFSHTEWAAEILHGGKAESEQEENEE